MTAEVVCDSQSGGQANASERRALLLLPGLLCDERLWRDQASALADIAQPMIANLTLDADISAMAARALENAPPKFALAALSMGGYVAFEILRQQPHRVTRIALFSTSAAPDSAERAAQRRTALNLLQKGRFLGVSAHLLPQLVHQRHVHSGVGEEVLAMAARVGGDAFFRQQTAILNRPDFRPVLQTVAVPTLVAVGEDDKLTPPADAHEISNGIRGARLHQFAECGHLPAMELPQQTSDLLREWLLAV